MFGEWYLGLIGFLPYFLNMVLSFLGWMCFDYLCMLGDDWLRVVPLCNFKFFDLTNLFYDLGLEYLIDFQKLPYCEYYNNILPLYLCLGLLTLESTLQILNFWVPHDNHVSLTSGHHTYPEMVLLMPTFLDVYCLNYLLPYFEIFFLWFVLSEVNLSNLGVCISVL